MYVYIIITYYGIILQLSLSFLLVYSVKVCGIISVQLVTYIQYMSAINHYSDC